LLFFAPRNCVLYMKQFYFALIASELRSLLFLPYVFTVLKSLLIIFICKKSLMKFLWMSIAPSNEICSPLSNNSFPIDQKIAQYNRQTNGRLIAIIWLIWWCACVVASALHLKSIRSTCEDYHHFISQNNNLSAQFRLIMNSFFFFLNVGQHQDRTH